MKGSIVQVTILSTFDPVQNADEIFMQRALQLADLGRLTAAPNPRVGAVIVYKNKIIGEGFHQQYGEPHAEVNAVASVKDSSILSESTIYVTLEPCSHFGKTPPCADLLIQHAFKRVVICNKDPFEKVDGNGIKKLRKAGIEVAVGCLEKEGREINRRFFTFHEKQRPYIILKWAQSADGFIAPKNNQQKWISNPILKQIVHLWRAEEDTILVGKNTAIADNPELTVREVAGTNPTRILIDKELSVPKSNKIFNGVAPTIILNAKKTEKQNNLEYIKIETRNSLAKTVTNICHQRNLQSIIIEGGANILEQFIATNLWDEARIIKGDSTFETGVKAPKIKGNLISESTHLNNKLTILTNGTV